jgi:hypothetical protein
MTTITWVRLEELWPPFGQGSVTLLCNGEGERFVALVLPQGHDEDEWRISFLFDHLHFGMSGLAHEEEAKARAAQELARVAGIRSRGSAFAWDSPMEETLVLLLSFLDDDWQVDHITEYKREWVAVCRSNDSKQIADYAFTYDSDDMLGQREVLDYMGIYPIEE